jgi:hypothetical protein
MNKCEIDRCGKPAYFKRGARWCCERHDQVLSDFASFVEAGEFVLPWNPR